MTRAGLGPPTAAAIDAPRATRKVRRAAKSKADKARRRRAARRAAEERARKRERFTKARRRQVELHGIDAVRRRIRDYVRAWRKRHLGVRRHVSIRDQGPATRDAINAANGDRNAAARALGISLSSLHSRIRACSIPRGKKQERLYDWLRRVWPQRGGHRAVDVIPPVVYVPAATVYSFACGHSSTLADRCEDCDDTRDALDVIASETREAHRVYVLAAHGDVPEGEHVNRVPAVGKVRSRVVCKVCREKRI